MQFNFNASQVAPATTYEPIPAGNYIAMITESDVQPTQSGSGEFIKLTFQICEGAYANRKIITRLNVRNSNPKAEEIAQAQLSAICHAINVTHLSDTTQLHNIPLSIKVEVKAADGSYGASNEIKGYAPANQAKPAQAASMPAAVPSKAAPPWAKQAA